jgi:mono/diheme cytochrome c family protein
MSMLLVALMAAPLLQAPAEAPVGDVQKGAAVWRQKFCANCHGDNGEGGFGPDLAGGRGLTWEQFKHPIRKPWGVMLAYTEQQLPDQAIADVYAFIKTKPRVTELGHWHWPAAPASAPYGQKVYMQMTGCSQCHEPENKFARKWLGEHAKEMSFEYFKKQIYTHTAKYPRGGMGNYSPDRLAEPTLREVYKFLVEDLGMRASVAGSVTVGEQQGGNTTYKIAVRNPGVKDNGLAAEGVTVFVRIPVGTKVVGGTGPGYKGAVPFKSLGLVPALRLAPHPDEQGRTIRPAYDDTGHAVTWKFPKLAAADKVELTFTLAGAPSASLVEAMEGSAVHWEKPGRTPFGQKLTYRDLRTPDTGDHERLSPPRLP